MHTVLHIALRNGDQAAVQAILDCAEKLKILDWSDHKEVETIFDAAKQSKKGDIVRLVLKRIVDNHNCTVYDHNARVNVDNRKQSTQVTSKKTALSSRLRCHHSNVCSAPRTTCDQGLCYLHRHSF